MGVQAGGQSKEASGARADSRGLPKGGAPLAALGTPIVRGAAGALARSHAGIALSVTGIAGPDGGSPEKPVGLVWFGLARRGEALIAEKHIFANNGRAFIRRETVRTALEMGLKALE